jgi:hypothetical protein
MSAEQEKAVAFVTRLLSNPSLAPLSPLQREEQIIQFLHANSGQLGPTLATPSFFPGMPWYQIVALLLQALTSVVDRDLLPGIDNVASRINFAFVNHLAPQGRPSAEIRTEVGEFAKQLMAKMEARRVMTGAYAALVFGVTERYMNQIWARRSYIHRELTRVQALKMAKDEVQGMTEATLLLKPIITLVASGNATVTNEEASGTIQTQYAEKVVSAGQKSLPKVPADLIKSAVGASISFQDNRFVEATGRLAAILAARCRNYQPNIRVDRGADSPDKSWLSIARRNYKFYGFDVKMLDELFSIAAENGW